VARIAGVDRSTAPTGSATGVGTGGAVTLLYAEVTLRLTDGVEFREWPARVGFTSYPLRRALRGYAGALQFFDVTFRGERELIEIDINSKYPGS